MKKALILINFLIMPMLMQAQEVSDFLWKNRLVIVFTTSENSALYESQLEEFQTFPGEFRERKLRFIHSLPERHQIVFPDTSQWQQDSNLYDKLKEKDSDFEIILIGLDGGVKLRQTGFLESKRLFDLIDSMPMRQAEMRKNH